MRFIPIPAIDILGGSCVRLEQGDYLSSTKYRDDPAEVATEFAAACSRIHVVDLDGAKTGKTVNAKAIGMLVSAARRQREDVQVQVGGGLRTIDDIEATLDLGVAYVVLGTAAVRDPGFLRDACEAAPGKVLLGLDARDGRIAVSGWTEDTGLDLSEFARSASSTGIAGIIHTDIRRDGMMTGANVEATARLADETDCPVFASGGVSSREDLSAMRETSIAGAIVGKALYTGKVRIEDLAMPIEASS